MQDKQNKPPYYDKVIEVLTEKEREIYQEYLKIGDIHEAMLKCGITSMKERSNFKVRIHYKVNRIIQDFFDKYYNPSLKELEKK